MMSGSGTWDLRTQMECGAGGAQGAWPGVDHAAPFPDGRYNISHEIMTLPQPWPLTGSGSTAISDVLILDMVRLPRAYCTLRNYMGRSKL